MTLPKISVTAITEVKTIGSGTFAKVKLVYLNADVSMKMALKELKSETTFNENWMQKRIKKEVEALSQLSQHSSFIRILHLFETEPDCISGYTMEYLMYGNIRSFLHQMKTMGERATPLLKALWMLQVSDGFQFLQERVDGAILHRDLTADNVLIDDELNAKIADFGLAKVLPKSVMTQETSEFEMRKGIERVLPETYYDSLRPPDQFGDRYLYSILVFETFTEIVIRECLNERSLQDDYKAMVKEGRHLDYFETKIKKMWPPNQVEATHYDSVQSKVVQIVRLMAHQVPENRESFSSVSEKWRQCGEHRMDTERRQTMHRLIGDDSADNSSANASLDRNEKRYQYHQSSREESENPGLFTWEFFLQDGKKQLIGKGRYANVYKAVTERFNFVACKVVKLNYLRPNLVNDLMRLMMLEVDVLKKLRHPNIVQFLHFEYTQNHFYLITELVVGENLVQTMQRQGKPFGECAVKHFSKQIVSALNYLHYLPSGTILHRDVKCSNILFSNDSGIIKLLDFGLTLPNMVTDYSSDFVGITYFMAPELLVEEYKQAPDYSIKSDVWAFGCTVFEMTEMRPPNADVHPILVLSRIRELEMPPIAERFSADLREFYRRCVVKDPKERADTEELLKHRFLSATSEP